MDNSHLQLKFFFRYNRVFKIYSKICVTDQLLYTNLIVISFVSSDQESIVPNFFLRKQRIFPFFAAKLGRCTVHTFIKTLKLNSEHWKNQKNESLIGSTLGYPEVFISRTTQFERRPLKIFSLTKKIYINKFKIAESAY